jgi:hypothetical protein
MFCIFLHVYNNRKLIMISTPTKSHRCDVCNKAFTRKSNLQRHMLIHTGVKPFVCDYEGCDFKCVESGNLTKHKRTHTGNKPYPCDFPECGKKFSHSNDLTKHKRTHTGKKPYVCDYSGCDMSFSESGNLTKHKRTHTGKKPHVCTFQGCGYRCTRSDTLQTHTRTHSGEKPFVCTFKGCDYKFIISGNLKTHMHTHIGEKPYSCDYEGCEFKCIQSGSPKKHIKALHSSEALKRHKRQETWITNVLEEAGIDYKREHRVDFTCVDDMTSRDQKFWASIDFVITVKGGIVFLEVDEGQHRFGDYSVLCDMARMTKVIESVALEGNTLPILFIRLNSDGFKIDGKTKRTLKRIRSARLIDLIKKMKFDKRSPLLQIQYMYYDCVMNHDKQHLKIHDDLDYHDNLKTCCLTPIID